MFNSNCGERIPEGSSFSSACGTGPTAGSAPVRSARRIHCPSCGSTKLQITASSSSSVGTGVGRSYGRYRIGTARTDTTVRHSWFCKECGKHFRDPDELRKEAAKEKRNSKILLITLIVFAVFTILCLTSEAALMGVLFLPLTLWFLLLFVITKKRAVDKGNEFVYLNTNCF